MSKIPQDPIIMLSESNNDDTTDYQAGSISPFNVIITSNGFASVIPAEQIDAHFYGFGETLSSGVYVEGSR